MNYIDAAAKLWANKGVRYIVYGLIVLAAILVARKLIIGIIPPPKDKDFAAVDDKGMLVQETSVSPVRKPILKKLMEQCDADLNKGWVAWSLAMGHDTAPFYALLDSTTELEFKWALNYHKEFIQQNKPSFCKQVTSQTWSSDIPSRISSRAKRHGFNC